MYEGIYSTTRNDLYVDKTVPAAATTVSGGLPHVPEGFCWYVERMTCKSSTTQASPVLEIFVVLASMGPSDGGIQGRVDVAATQAVVQNGVSDESSPIYVGPGQKLLAVWSGVTAGDRCQLSAQVRVHQLVGTASRGQHPSQWSGSEAWNGDRKVGEYVVVGDQVAET